MGGGTKVSPEDYSHVGLRETLTGLLTSPLVSVTAAGRVVAIMRLTEQ